MEQDSSIRICPGAYLESILIKGGDDMQKRKRKELMEMLQKLSTSKSKRRYNKTIRWIDDIINLEYRLATMSRSLN
jgi:hypothetical protein